MIIKTARDLTPTNIAHLKKFKEFLTDTIITSESRFVAGSWQTFLRAIIQECEIYVTQIDALLGENK